MKSFPFVFFVLPALFSLAASAADVAVVGGQAYKLVPLSPPTCGAFGSPELTAAKTILLFAKQNGAATASALCAAGKSEYCSNTARLKFGIQQLFTAIRSYPSQFNSDGCKALREECVSLCSADAVVTSQECLIECNQYESWNK